MDTEFASLEAVSKFHRESEERDTALGVRLKAIEDEIGAVKKIAKWIGLALGILSPAATGVTGYLVREDVTTQARTQAAAVATTVVEADSDARLKRMLKEALAEGRAERDRELEAARIAEVQRQVTAERAASMRSN